MKTDKKYNLYLKYLEGEFFFFILFTILGWAIHFVTVIFALLEKWLGWESSRDPQDPIWSWSSFFMIGFGFAAVFAIFNLHTHFIFIYNVLKIKLLKIKVPMKMVADLDKHANRSDYQILWRPMIRKAFSGSYYAVPFVAFQTNQAPKFKVTRLIILGNLIGLGGLAYAISIESYLIGWISIFYYPGVVCHWLSSMKKYQTHWIEEGDETFQEDFDNPKVKD